MPNPSELERQIKESKPVGQETAQHALAMVQKILTSDIALRELVTKTSCPFEKQDQNQWFWTCSVCTDGHLHGVGHNKLPSGHIVNGGLLVCDTCGHHERRR